MSSYPRSDEIPGFNEALVNLKKSLEYSIDSIAEILSFNVKYLEEIELMGLEMDVKELIHDWHGTTTQRQNTEIVSDIKFLQNVMDDLRKEQIEFEAWQKSQGIR